MKKYDPDSRCGACGNLNASSEYTDDRWNGYQKLPACIERVCLHCGYTWDERPLNHKEDK